MTVMCNDCPLFALEIVNSLRAQRDAAEQQADVGRLVEVVLAAPHHPILSYDDWENEWCVESSPDEEWTGFMLRDSDILTVLRAAVKKLWLEVRDAEAQ
jgi:hypothetical protein